MMAWAYVGTVVSYVNASYLGARFGDASLSIRQSSELLDREASRTESLRKLTDQLLDLANEGRTVTQEVSKWARRHLAGKELVDAETALLNGHGTIQALLDAARSGHAEPGDLAADLGALAAGWKALGLGARGVGITVTVDPRVGERASSATVSQMHLLASRCLQNVVAKTEREVVGAVVIDAYVRPDGWPAITIRDDGGGATPEPSDLGDGLSASRYAFQYVLAGEFTVSSTEEWFRVDAAAPADDAERPADQRTEHWPAAEAVALISDSLRATVLTTAIQELAIALLDRRDPRRWAATATALALIAKYGRAAPEPSDCLAFVLSLASAATAVVDHDDAWAMTGAMLMTTADIAWHGGAKPSLPLVAAHGAATFTRSRGRPDARRLAIDAVLPTLAVIGSVLVVRSYLAGLSLREHAVGQALDRADMHLQIHTVLMENHDINLPFAKIPLHRNREGRALEERLETRRTVYDGLKAAFAGLLTTPTQLESALRRAVGASGGGTHIGVSVLRLPPPSERRAGRLAAAVMQRSTLVDLSTLTVSSVLRRFPRDLLGRRRLRRIDVEVGPVHQELVLTIKWVPEDHHEPGELRTLASTATRGGGALEHRARGEITVRFPVP
jgi:hypothetical protein